MRLLVCCGPWVGVDGWLAGPAAGPALRYEPAGCEGGSEPPGVGGKGLVAARVLPTAPIQRMFMPTVMGPGSAEGGSRDRVVVLLGPRLTRSPEIRAGLNCVVELLLCMRWARMMPQVSSVMSTSRASGSCVGSVGGSTAGADGVAAGVSPSVGSGETPAPGVAAGVLGLLWFDEVGGV